MTTFEIITITAAAMILYCWLGIGFYNIVKDYAPNVLLAVLLWPFGLLINSF